MDKSEFTLPSPVFQEMPKKAKLPSPHFASPEGMLLSSTDQPPPMYGPRGATIPAKYLVLYQKQLQKYELQKIKHKETVEKESKSQNFHQKFWCETCDQPFDTQPQLIAHKSDHQKCGINGCPFVGHPEALAIHIEEQHTSGLFEQIKNLNTPEDIKKWREERRKRYPTIANVELRRKAQEERRKRGEKLEGKKSRFGQKSDRRQMFNKKDGLQHRENEKTESVRRKVKSKKRKQFGDVKPNTNTEKPINADKGESKIDKIQSNSLTKFKGTGSIINYKKITEKKVVKNPLVSLLGMYGSDSDSSSESDSDSQSIENSENATPEQSESPKMEISDAEIEKEEFKTVKDSNSAEKGVQFIQNNSIDERKKLKIDDSQDICEAELSNSISANNLPCQVPAISDDEMPEEQPIIRSSDVKSTDPEVQTSFQNTKNSRKPKDKTKKNLLDYSKLRKTRQNTLLEKLIEPEIRHERNVLLQCVRYVVQNNFLGIGSSNKN